MGIVILPLSQRLFISAHHKTDALKATQSLYEPVDWECPFDWRRPSQRLEFVDNEAVYCAVSLEEALRACRWSPWLDDDGNIVYLDFINEKLGSEDRLFTALAPFVKSGSYILVASDFDDDGVWRWLFEGGSVTRQPGKIVFYG